MKMTLTLVLLLGTTAVCLGANDAIDNEGRAVTGPADKSGEVLGKSDTRKPTTRPVSPEKGEPTSRPKSKPKAPPAAERIKPIRCKSAAELVSTVMTALEKKDTKTLHALRVDFAEYEKILWPRFVDDRPQLKKQQPKFHYFLLEAKSKSGVMDIVGEFGGKKLELIGFGHDRVEDYQTFKLWRTINVEFLVDGKKTRERLFGAIIERDGKFYLLSYPS